MTYLELKWTVSRGRETYGYNIVTSTDTESGKKYKAMGGGYDMRGTVFSEWLQETHADALANVKPHHIRNYDADGNWLSQSDDDDGYYGLTFRIEASRLPGDSDVSTFTRVTAHLDGACGFESMRAIAEAIGLTARWANMDRKGNAGGIIVERAS